MHARALLRLLGLAGALAATASGRAHATVLLPLSDEGLVRSSALIVTGEVSKIESVELRSGRIVTEITLRVEEALKGRVPDGAVVVTEPGGDVGERAVWIQRRYDDLVRALQLPETLERDPMYQLRMEIGDSEFERYLIATGRDPVVYITRPQPNTRAALLGFQHNDRITSYDGHRVFDHREIRLLDSEGTAGSVVSVEFIRDGLPMQIYIQRGSFDAPLYPAFAYLPGGR